MPDESIIHADIFFFVSTISLVVLTILLTIAAVYVIRILRNATDVSDRFKEEGEEIVGDLKKLRANLRDEGVKWKHVVGLFRSLIAGRAVRKAKKKSEAKSDEIGGPTDN